MDNETPVPRGILFVLDAPEYSEHRLESLKFDREIFELEAQGRCVVPRIKWIN